MVNPQEDYISLTTVPVPSAQIESTRLLRVLKSVLIDLAGHHVLSWKTVSAIFRLIPELKGA